MAASKLVLRDLNFVRQELHSVKEKWLDIGMELGASPTELRKIAETHKQDYSICLNLMLMQWLEGGDASWKILCEALKSSTIDESSLSTQLYEKHCKEKSSGPTSGKSVKRASTDDTTVPKAKRPKATPLPTSFPPEDFLRPQPPNRICYKCHKIARTPLRPECCNTMLYCEPCSLKVKMCSTHQTENKFKRDDELFYLIPQIKIKCPNWKEGCEYKDTISKVHRKHLLECPKSKSAHKEGTEDAGTTLNTKDPDSKAIDDRKPSSELEEEDVWYVANEELQPHKTTSTPSSTTAPPATGTLKTILSSKDKTSPSLPTKKPNGDIPGQGGRNIPPIFQQQAPKSSANVQTPALQLQKPPGGSAFVPVQQQAKSSANALRSPVESQTPGDSGVAPVQGAKCPGADRVTAQVVYDVNQLALMIQQLPANQMVWCIHKASGCSWKGVATQLIQHLSVCQYNPKSIQTKVKTEIKQESQAPPAAVVVPAHQPVKTQQAQYIKQEPSSPQILFGGHQAAQVKQEPSSNTVLRSEMNQNTLPCEYNAIGCREMVPKGKMKQHLQENIQHHLDLAIKRILQNEAKK